MKIGINDLRQIILEEAKKIREGCGEAAKSSPCPACEVGEECPCHVHGDVIGHEDSMFDVSPEIDQDNMLSKGEALNAVTAIAQNTSCPVTRQALMSVVDDLSQMGVGEDEDLSSDSAFGAGEALGREYRDEFSYTGDVPSDTGAARSLGYTAGLMGLTGG